MKASFFPVLMGKSSILVQWPVLGTSKQRAMSVSRDKKCNNLNQSEIHEWSIHKILTFFHCLLGKKFLTREFPKACHE